MGGYSACYWNSLNPQTESNPNRDLKNSLSLKISILILTVSKKTQKQRLKIVNIWFPPPKKRPGTITPRWASRKSWANWKSITYLGPSGSGVCMANCYPGICRKQWTQKARAKVCPHGAGSTAWWGSLPAAVQEALETGDGPAWVWLPQVSNACTPTD